MKEITEELWSLWKPLDLDALVEQSIITFSQEEK